MMFPMMFPAPCGPPTEFALRMRKWLLTLLVLMMVCCGFRIYFGDPWGGVVMIFTAVLGGFIIRDEMDITYCTIFGMFCMMNCMFDIILVLESSARLPHPIFSPKLTATQNAKHIAFLAAPILEGLGAWLSWELYRDHEQEEGQLLWAPGFADDYDAIQPSRVQRPQARTFSPYQGKAHKLADEESTDAPTDVESKI